MYTRHQPSRPLKARRRSGGNTLALPLRSRGPWGFGPITLRRALRLVVLGLASAGAVVGASSPAAAWSSDGGAVAIHSDSSYSGSVGEVQVDSAGNIYACGNYRGTGDIDPNPAVSNQLSVTGGGSSVVS